MQALCANRSRSGMRSSCSHSSDWSCSAQADCSPTEPSTMLSSERSLSTLSAASANVWTKFTSVARFSIACLPTLPRNSFAYSEATLRAGRLLVRSAALFAKSCVRRKCSNASARWSVRLSVLRLAALGRDPIAGLHHQDRLHPLPFLQ